MSTRTISPGIVDAASVRKAVDRQLGEFLRECRTGFRHPRMADLVQLVEDFLAGGKRIRPTLTFLGWRAAGGEGDETAVLRVAASLEMFHSFALIHDDIMDDSDTRRGRPTIHRILAGRSPGERAEKFGIGAAVLLGDLVFTWSDQLLHTASLTRAQTEAVLPLVTEMRTEVMLGQYLDLRATGELTDD
ncbi:polyprenyl synthetase family protein, partial [Streptomyces fradiae]